jgi:hypothetical protein
MRSLDAQILKVLSLSLVDISTEGACAESEKDIFFLLLRTEKNKFACFFFSLPSLVAEKSTITIVLTYVLQILEIDNTHVL